MTPLKICFTGMELDPSVLTDRAHHGVISPEWNRYRFYSNVSVLMLNRWLLENIEGRWAVYMSYTASKREITVAFERDTDGVLFVLSNGPQQCENMVK